MGCRKTLLLMFGNGWADCVEIWYAFRNPLGTGYPVVTGGVPLHVITCTPERCISETARSIAFKFAVWLAAHYWRGFHMSCVTFHIAVCTCARAHPISVYQKRLDRSRSNLLCGWEPIGYEVFTCHGSHSTLRSARAHVHTPHLYLRNGLADCAQIWCAFVTQSVCAVGGLRGWRFARLAVCAVGGLRGWRFARLAVCAVGGLRGGWFPRLAVCAVCVWWFAFGGLRLEACVLQFAVGRWRLTVGVVVLQLEFCGCP